MTEGEQPKRPRRSRAAPDEPAAPVAPPTPPPEAEAAEPEPPHGLPLGRVAFALILLAVGVGWLLHSLDLIDVPWDALLPVSLIAVGAVLVIGSRTGHHSGLIALGIVLTLVTALTAAVDVPLIGGAGQNVVQPTSVDELEPRYDLAVGQLVIDLTELQLTGDEQIRLEARVGLGELVVELPQGILPEAHARAGLGDVQVLGEQASGFSPERTVGSCDRGRQSGSIRTPTGCLLLDLSVGLGSVKVNQ